MGNAALLIDFGGTLDADGIPWVDRFLASYRDAGGSATTADFRAAFGASDVVLAALSGVAAFNYSETVAAQCELLTSLLMDGELLTAPEVSAGLVAAARAAAAVNLPVLTELRDRYKLAVVSNYQGNLRPSLAELGLADAFDVLSDSSVVGARKPDRRIFDVTLQALGSTAAESWMIGDSPPNDIAAAADLGMRTCWIAPVERALPSIMPSARAARFVDVIGVLAA